METVTRNWSDLSRKVLGAVVGAIAAGTATVSGLDSVILWLWNGVFGLAGTGAEMPATVAAVIGTALGALIGGYLPKEKLAADAKVTPSSNSVLRSPPVATGVAFLAALAVIGFLSGCAPAAGGAAPADTSGIQKNIAYAEGYVAVGKAAAATCIALKLPVCSSPAFADGVAKASAVADQAIAEAKSYPIDGSTQDKINAALRVAMNAVLLFYSLR
ncbi:hypothetical protein [Inquilinus limosus]|uniref:Uncharacterized protein n=1 Tax=Inquilinus limosus TaxID=171674 RepID=A0A211ZQA8_9PROT|nr:hypothetical protein [Inquilinus limosus]OWJ67462.1 hypothetical protein BWR60_09660 [Inquilinus limosus]